MVGEDCRRAGTHSRTITGDRTEGERERKGREKEDVKSLKRLGIEPLPTGSLGSAEMTVFQLAPF